MIRFLLYITHPYGIPICKPLEIELKKRNFEVKWFVEKESTENYLKDQEEILTIEEVLDYSPNIVLAASDYIADFFPGIKVQLFHGFLANKRKGIDHFNIRNFYDLYCTQGPSTTKIFKEKSKRLKHFEVVETGWPKMDPLYYPKNHPLENQKPVLMIASTFTKSYSLALNETVYKEIKRLSEEGNYTIQMVLHPLLDKKTKERYAALNNKNFTYYDTTDIIPLFKNADVILCDTSSALIEFLMQIKPAVTFNHNIPLPSYINILHASDIEKNIEYALSKPKKIIEEIKKYAALTHPYTDGKSSGRVIDASLNLLQKDKSSFRKKPIDLIRKYKIRKSTHFWTLKSFNKPITLNLEKEKVTACIITYNEEKNIDAVLSQLSFADEIIVIDSGSTDKTIEIVNHYKNVKLLKRKFDNFSNQKNFGISQATNDWILFFDADERITQRLKHEIIDILRNPAAKDAYYIRRKFYYKNKPMHFSGWQNDKAIRLFKKGKAKYGDLKLVHETLIVKGNIGIMKNKLNHFSLQDEKIYKEKLNLYAKLKAEELFKKKRRASWVDFNLKPIVRFLHHYLFRMGILDGENGFKIAKMYANYVHKRYIYLNDLYKSET